MFLWISVEIYRDILIHKLNVILFYSGIKNRDVVYSWDLHRATKSLVDYQNCVMFSK